jgi:hypothetical protein
MNKPSDPIWTDCVFLAGLTALSSVFYVSRLGFYWDDWRLLQLLHFSSDQSLGGLMRALFTGWPDLRVRPVQALQLAVLYQLFGMKPLGHHLMNTAILFLGVGVFYFALLLLIERRLMSLTVAAIYGVLPHYSTDRFWYANFCANLSMIFYFLSLYCDLKSVKFQGSRVWRWKGAASLSLVISSLSYEVFMPLFLLNPVLIAIKRWQLRVSGKSIRWNWMTSALFYLASPLLLGLIGVIKGRYNRRAPDVNSVGWWLVDNTFSSSADLTYGAYLLNLPHILWTISSKYWDWPAFLIALALGVVIATYLMQVAKTSEERPPHFLVLVLTLCGATLVSGMSYAYFYSYYGVNTGVNNRVAIAAAVPVAISWASLAALLSSMFLRRAISNRVFCILVALLCASACLITNTVSSFWIAAAQKRSEILRDMKENFRPPRGSSVLLTGLCAWEGPGIVFEADWDVTGALALLYEDNTIKGTVLWPWMKAQEQGIESGRNVIYSFASLYSYDVRTKQASLISDTKTAAFQIEKTKEDDVKSHGCLSSGFGTGLAVW